MMRDKWRNWDELWEFLISFDRLEFFRLLAWWGHGDFFSLVGLMRRILGDLGRSVRVPKFPGRSKVPQHRPFSISWKPKAHYGNVLLLRNAKIGIFYLLPPFVTQNPTNAFYSVRFCHKVQTPSLLLERYVMKERSHRQ